MTEIHPWKPFIPDDAKILMLGSFPPSPKRWSIDFYYPNLQNDMWRIFGLIFFNDKNHFLTKDLKAFDKKSITSFLNQSGIAMFDTAIEIERATGTASDKDLIIIKETNIIDLLRIIPNCNIVITTGTKSAEVCAKQLNCKIPSVGECSIIHVNNRKIRLYRTPSTSRAYPMKLEMKAEIYKKVFTTNL